MPVIPKEVQRYILAGVCGYEALALFYKRVPTVSHICWKLKFPIPVVIAGLTFHLMSPPQHMRKIKMVLEEEILN